MNLNAFFDEMFEVLDAAAIGLTIPDETGARAGEPPAPYVMLPEINYQEPGPGLHRIEDLVVTVVFGPANNPRVFRTALEYASTSGTTKSIWAALRAHTWTSVGTVFIRSAIPNHDSLRDSNPQVAYDFHIDITGG